MHPLSRTFRASWSLAAWAAGRCHGSCAREGVHTPNDATQLPFQRLEIYVVAKAIAVLVHRADIGDAELRDQARRASKSAFLNLSEGLPSDSTPMRRRYVSSAAGSVCETAAAVDLAAALGLIDDFVSREVLGLCVRLKQMLRALA